jgi:hypothetical protein
MLHRNERTSRRRCVVLLVLALVPVSACSVELPPLPDRPGHAPSAPPPLPPLRTADDAARALLHYVEHFTGPRPLDCGHVVWQFGSARDETRLHEFLACGNAARARSEGFWTFTQQHGVDSWYLQGVLGAPDGTAFVFMYDDAPCGGPGCPGRFNISRCDVPIVRVEHWPVFVCRWEDGHASAR